MRTTRTLTALALGLGLTLTAAPALAHEPTPDDYARVQEACAQYEDQGGCPGSVIQANLHPETLCTPTTTPACTNGPTAAAPLASTGPVPPAPGPVPSPAPLAPLVIVDSFEVAGSTAEVAGSTAEVAAVITDATIAQPDATPAAEAPAPVVLVAAPRTSSTPAPVLQLPDAVRTAVAVAEVMRLVTA